VKKELGSAQQQHPTTRFAFNVLKYQAYFHLCKFSKMKKKTSIKRPSSTPATTSVSASGIGTVTTAVPRSSLPSIHFHVNTSAEEKAAIKIQACFKGFYTNKLGKACIPGKFHFAI